ncbi:hypothetical protein CEXT_291681 [Caerostris extrusa]|uniref:Uncharacterized protein n=1 Tax=Caerostris extrusa TaxID=172846 RepID=A0AAV4WWC0_CAEEX|nr:hypothetical protein CEXT_291681 [Caerostris extrusa]
MRHLLPRPNETLNFYYLSKLHSRSRKQTYLSVMPDSRPLFLPARYYQNSTGTIHHRRQVKNPHRLPIRKLPLVNLFPGVCSPMARCCDCPYYHRFQGSVKSLGRNCSVVLRGDRRADRIYSVASGDWIASV